MINSAYTSHNLLMMETEKVSKMSELCSNLMQVVTWEFIIVIQRLSYYQNTTWTNTNLSHFVLNDMTEIRILRINDT